MKYYNLGRGYRFYSFANPYLWISLSLFQNSFIQKFLVGYSGGYCNFCRWEFGLHSPYFHKTINGTLMKRRKNNATD